MTELLLPALYVDSVRSPVEAARPLLINRDPGPDEVGAPRRPEICIEVIDTALEPPGIGPGATVVWVNDVMAWAFSLIQPGFSGYSTTDGASQRVCVRPDVAFASETLVTVRVFAKTIDNAELDQSYTFTVEDFTAPAVVAAVGSARRVVTVSFAEAVVVTDVAGFVFERVGAPGVSLTAVSAVASGSTVAVTTHQEMSPGIEYRVTVTGVEDLAGNAAEAPTNTALFAGFQPQQPPNRRFWLWDYIPNMNKREDASGDLYAFILVLQEIVDLLLADLDAFSAIWSIERAPERFIDLALGDLGNPFIAFELDELQKRKLAATLIDIYRLKGTEAGIIGAVNFFVGILVEIDTVRRTGIQLGVSELAWPATDKSVAGPFNLFDGATLEVVVSGGEVQTVAFDADDVDNIDAVTEAEAVAIINAALAGATAVIFVGGGIQLRTVEQSPDATIQVVGGTAELVFGFLGDLAAGGGDFVLGSSNRRLLYSFRVLSPVALTDTQREQITAIAEYMKPAHTHLIGVFDPPVDEVLDHWLLGLSVMGESTDLH